MTAGVAAGASADLDNALDTLIECHNLVKIYQVAGIEVVALQGLDLIVARGEMLGIVGASGSGKSTLLNVLGGLDRPSAGGVQVDGHDLLQATAAELDRYRRETVGFVWQQTARNLVPYLSALQNVLLPMRIAGIPWREQRPWAEELLRAVGLWELRRSRLAQLSGGQQQRVAIAVALANRPALLLADEPTGELDLGTSREVMALLRQVNARYQTTVIIVTHDPAVAESVDRVVTIRDGRTSSETVRRAADATAVDATAVDATAVDATGAVAATLAAPATAGAPAATVDEHVVVDRAGRLQLPAHLAERHAIGRRVTLESRPEGILIKPSSTDGPLATEPAVTPDKAPPRRRRWPWQRRRAAPDPDIEE